MATSTVRQERDHVDFVTGRWDRLVAFLDMFFGPEVPDLFYRAAPDGFAVCARLDRSDIYTQCLDDGWYRLPRVDSNDHTQALADDIVDWLQAMSLEDRQQIPGTGTRLVASERFANLGLSLVGYRLFTTVPAAEELEALLVIPAWV